MRQSSLKPAVFRPLLLSHHADCPALLLLLLSGEAVEDLFKGDLAERVLPHPKLGDIVLVQKRENGG